MTNGRMPFSQSPIYKHWHLKERIYKSGCKSLTFIQYFYVTYTEWNFTEFSKVHKEATLLSGNTLHWWTTLLDQGQASSFMAWIQTSFLFGVVEKHFWSGCHDGSAQVGCRKLSKCRRIYYEVLRNLVAYYLLPDIFIFLNRLKHITNLPEEIRNFFAKANVKIFIICSIGEFSRTSESHVWKRWKSLFNWWTQCCLICMTM